MKMNCFIVLDASPKLEVSEGLAPSESDGQQFIPCLSPSFWRVSFDLERCVVTSTSVCVCLFCAQISFDKDTSHSIVNYKPQ